LLETPHTVLLEERDSTSNNMTLTQGIGNVLEKRGKASTVKEIFGDMKKLGFKTTRPTIASTLSRGKDRLWKRIGRGQFVANNYSGG